MTQIFKHILRFLWIPSVHPIELLRFNTCGSG